MLIFLWRTKHSPAKSRPNIASVVGSGTRSTCPRISPPGFAAVWMLIYQKPASRPADWTLLITVLPIEGLPGARLKKRSLRQRSHLARLAHESEQQ
jgi:hypothetical protein